MRRELAPPGDALALTRALVACDSRNPAFAPDAPGEGAAAQLLADTLTAWGFTVDLVDAAPGRPNVLARIGGGHGGRSLILNGHLDTVGVAGMTHDPFGADVRDGRLYGRGSCDMKAGVAAMCAAAHRAASTGLGGEVIIAAVADEEWESIGTRHLLAMGLRAHAAIVTEPTRLAICPAHRGFSWADVRVEGRAAHGSRYDIGIDAVTHAALLLAELDGYQRDVLPGITHPLLGRASFHAGPIHSDGSLSAYPAWCTVGLERRTLPGEDGAHFVHEIEAAIARVAARTPNFRASVTPGLIQQPNDVPVDHALVQGLKAAATTRGAAAPIEGLSCWTDAALFTAAGIPAICFGPGDIGLAHAAEEYCPVDEIAVATDVLTQFVVDWCGPKGVAWGS
ncbi:ArgE/DapE family deacylase [Pseudogemmatithrix spongiicola]|uniref:Probable succinyl-diaminopimelate desuccinylase n=1 Tax=Pseudogemmatithrix spongiicola TaxID=3062599 RepID=A0AA49Q489_9BACT|nr:ArgE/DapE family deacylase [Gemmatimonadaceae bacterium 'strain 138']WKW13920.1 ArgE/DapE family deacylase [Gemmatimonadaceae bacterium 'strain 318']